MIDSLSSLIRAVESADSSERLLEAVEKLAAAGQEGAVPTLIAILSYNNPGAAVAAVDGLIKLGECAVPALLEQLDLYNYTARAWTIRALAKIGDPRGLVILLGAATTDFALSVRRAAARGLGIMNWRWFPDDILNIAQEQVLTALLTVAQQDSEWVVRYSAVLGLETLASAVTETHPEWRSRILTQFEQIAVHDGSKAVQARVWMAQQRLQAGMAPLSENLKDRPSPLSAADWQLILDQLSARKAQEHSASAENLRRDQAPDPAVAIAPQTGNYNV